MSINLLSSAAVNEKFMNWKLGGGGNNVKISQGKRPIKGRKLARSTVRRTTSSSGLRTT